MESQDVMMKMDKTIYDKLEKADGKRILVMNLWPRGIKKKSNSG